MSQHHEWSLDQVYIPNTVSHIRWPAIMVDSVCHILRMDEVESFLEGEGLVQIIDLHN